MLRRQFYQNIFFVVILLFAYNCTDNSKDLIEEQQLDQQMKSAKLTSFNGFYFVGNYAGKPSLYRYDKESDKTKLVWSSEKERVINLITSPDQTAAFFITKHKQRLKSSQPAIERGKLYRIDYELNKVEFITQLEDGIQIIAYWLDSDRFALVINSIDKTIASYINKNTQLYNKFGKLLSDKTEIFDLTKDGYPVTKMLEPRFTSPNGMFTVIEKNDSLLIQQKTSKKVKPISFQGKEVVQIEWAENKRNVILLLADKSKENETNISSSALIAIFDLKEKKTKKIFNDVPLKYFVLIGDFLIFDSGKGRDSHIRIFNLSALSDFKIVKMSGGCSLKNI